MSVDFLFASEMASSLRADFPKSPPTVKPAPRVKKCLRSMLFDTVNCRDTKIIGETAVNRSYFCIRFSTKFRNKNEGIRNHEWH